MLLLSRFCVPPGSPHPWDSPGKNTGVGCHFLLRCRKGKSESEVTQLCLTLSDPMGCSLPGSSVHGSIHVRVLEWVAIAFSDFIHSSVYIYINTNFPNHPTPLFPLVSLLMFSTSVSLFLFCYLQNTYFNACFSVLLLTTACTSITISKQTKKIY